MKNCRFCSNNELIPFLDLGSAPHSNAYLSQAQLTHTEKVYPLNLQVCKKCWLVQTTSKIEAQDLFTADYAYFSSTSSSWLQHAKEYVEMISSRLQLTPKSFVLEIASNDGYLLQYFVSKNIPCLGIEPTECTAKSARERGVPTKEVFFGCEVARQLIEEGKQADLILGNNVLAHVPDINDFVHALAICLKKGGTVTLEFPHLLNLLQDVQFDTVYHEHYSYFSLYTVQQILKAHSLRIIDVQKLPTHGGSLRVFAVHSEDGRKSERSVQELINFEKERGLQTEMLYKQFQEKCDCIKTDLLQFLEEQRKCRKKVGAYGAAAKGNTILNYAQVGPDLLPYVCDAAPSKQGKYLPGSHIPILTPQKIKEDKPDFLVILPWNLSKEVISSHAYIRDWGGKFVTFIPRRSIV